jgi:hypothetical protein
MNDKETEKSALCSKVESSSQMRAKRKKKWNWDRIGGNPTSTLATRAEM